MKKPIIVLVFLFILSTLIACQADINVEKEEATKRANEIFTGDKINPNNNIGEVSLYLPAGMEVESSDDTNVVLKNGSNYYLLFLNSKEEQNSKVMYESTLKTANKVIVKETFEDDKRLGFIIVQEVNQEEDQYEVTVGIGGTKLTTETNVSNLAHEAEQMMKILNSIVEH